MALTRAEMDRRIDEHFAFEAADDVEGVLATLTRDVEHDIVGWPFGPSRGPEGARRFYEALFADLADGKVTSTRRLYGEDFLVDDSLWRGRAPGRPFGLEGRDRPLEFRLLHVVEFDGAGDIARENVWIDLAAIQAQTRLMARDNQRQRTRKDLLQAAARLMAEGRTPDLAEIAEAAMVSRATAYRYFPGLDALFNEAALDVAVPEAVDVFAGGGPSGLAERLECVDEAFDTMIRAHEAPLRTMLIHALQRQLKGEQVPLRQNRRTPVIEAAIAPAGLAPGAADLLAKAMALVVGTESLLVTKDVLGLDEAEARRVRRWALRALTEAALKEA